MLKEGLPTVPVYNKSEKFYMEKPEGQLKLWIASGVPLSAHKVQSHVLHICHQVR